MINEGLGKYLQTTWVTFPRFPHFYALASLRLSTKDDGKKKKKRKYCDLQITTTYFEVLSLKKSKHQVELWSQNDFNCWSVKPSAT